MPTVEYLNYDVLSDFDWSLEDADLFEKASDADIGQADYGEFTCGDGEFILSAAEARGLSWPLSCRTGSCANCAAIVISGEVSVGFQQILSQDEVENRDVRLTCIGTPETDHVQLVYNAKHIDYLENRVV